jgi:hypothetical protein
MQMSKMADAWYDDFMKRLLLFDEEAKYMHARTAVSLLMLRKKSGDEHY